MMDHPTDEAVPVETVIGPTSLPIGGAKSNSSEYRTAPQFTHRTLRGEKRTRGRSAPIPDLSEDPAAEFGGPPVVRKRRIDTQLFVPRDVAGGREVLGL